MAESRCEVLESAGDSGHYNFPRVLSSAHSGCITKRASCPFHDDNAPLCYHCRRGRDRTFVNRIGALTEQARRANPKRQMDFIQSGHMQPPISQSGQITRSCRRTCQTGSQPTVHCRGLRAVFKSMHGCQASFAAQWVHRVSVSIRDAHNGSVIPLQDFV
jgi:hypothetical protein